MAKKKNGSFWTIFALLFISIGSWALFEIIRLALTNLLNLFGIVNEYAILASILGIVFLLLLLSGYTLMRIARNLAN